MCGFLNLKERRKEKRRHSASRVLAGLVSIQLEWKRRESRSMSWQWAGPRGGGAWLVTGPGRPTGGNLSLGWWRNRPEGEKLSKNQTQTASCRNVVVFLSWNSLTPSLFSVGEISVSATCRAKSPNTLVKLSAFSPITWKRTLTSFDHWVTRPLHTSGVTNEQLTCRR